MLHIVWNKSPILYRLLPIKSIFFRLLLFSFFNWLLLLTWVRDTWLRSLLFHYFTLFRGRSTHNLIRIKVFFVYFGSNFIKVNFFACSFNYVFYCCMFIGNLNYWSFWVRKLHLRGRRPAFNFLGRFISRWLTLFVIWSEHKVFLLLFVFRH